MTKIKLLFGVCIGIFILNLFLLSLPISLPSFFSSYLNDLLCMPIVLSICIFFIKKISKQRKLRINLFSAFSLATLYAIYFEIYLPEVTERYTADVLDALLYFIGALIFYLFQEKPSKNLQQQE